MQNHSLVLLNPAIKAFDYTAWIVVTFLCYCLYSCEKEMSPIAAKYEPDNIQKVQ